MSLNTLPEGLQARLNTSFEVLYPEFPTFKLTPMNMTLIQEERSHDVLVIKYQLFGEWYNKALKTGTPVKVTWQNSRKAKGSFFGHVMSVKRKKAPQLDQELEVRCVASSFPLKNTASNIWTNKTVPEVVKDIAKKTGMKAVTSPNLMRYSQLSQFGTSYWQFLQELAYKIGFACYVQNSTIYFLDLDTVLKKKAGSLPLLSFSSDGVEAFMPQFHAPIEKTLDYFEPLMGDYIEDDDQPTRARKHITAVDPITGKSYDSERSPKQGRATRKNSAQVVFDDNTSFDVANSKMAADTLTSAKSARARFHIPAKFEAQGDPRIRPYGFVQVTGVDSTNDGVWMVRNVTHVISRRGHYTCFGIVVSEGRGQTELTDVRYKNGLAIPTLNLTDYNDGDSLSLSQAPALTKPSFAYNEQDSGYETSPRTWRA